MSVCDSEPLGLGLQSPPPPPPPPNAADATEALNLDFANLELEEKPDGWNQDPEGVEENAKISDVGGWDQEENVDGSANSPNEEGRNEEIAVVDGWGWDDDVTAPENPRSDQDFEASNEVKVDGWGWDQETGGSEERAKDEREVKAMKGQRKMPTFPVRPNEPDCAYYVKMGSCRFGMNCKFNHPPNKMRNKMKVRKSGDPSQMVFKENMRGAVSESNGQMECKYYSTPGGCKFGSSCKYAHKEKTEASVELNFLGLPMRPGQRECTYYMTTGSCKYSTNCRFHHPDPIAVGGQGPSSGYQNVESPQQHASPAPLPMTAWPVQRTPNEPVSYIDTSPSYLTGYYIPPQGYHPNPDWNGYQAPINPMFPPEMNMQHPQPTPAMKDTTRKGNGSAPKSVQDGDYPERPGQPECQFFMKTGSCKFKSACKFHHPKSCAQKASGGVDLNSLGLPVRPDQPTCMHYSRHRICKYGSSCRYNHPIDSNPSEAPESTAQNASPDSSSESVELKPEDRSDPVQNSEW